MVEQENVTNTKRATVQIYTNIFISYTCTELLCHVQTTDGHKIEHIEN